MAVHSTSPFYEDGCQDEINLSNFPGLTIDRRAYVERMAADTIQEQVSIPRVALNEKSSLWSDIGSVRQQETRIFHWFEDRYGDLPGWRERHRDVTDMAPQLADPVLSDLYDSATLSVHQLQRHKKLGRMDQRDSDPILDVHLLNNSDNVLLIYEIGVIPAAAWAVPKHIEVPEAIHPSASYEIRLDLEKRMSALRLDRPLSMPPKNSWVFSIKLIDLASQLNSVKANECVLAIRMRINQSAVQSGPLYLGVL